MRKEWKKSQVSRGRLNAELYQFAEEFLVAYKTEPLHDRYNDARLITREIVDNIYKHNPARTIIIVLHISQGHELTISIYHDGDEFDPFNPANDCKLLNARNNEYQFNARFTPNANGNYELILKLNLSQVVGA